jgi:hypothetical protein
MKPTQWMFVAMGVMAIGFPLSAGSIVTFTLLPSNGLRAGQAGTAVGWGYTIGTTSDFVTIQSIAFGDGTPIGAFSTPGIPPTVASAGTPFTTPWVEDSSGLQYDISAAAVSGAFTLGLMTLTYDAYSDAELTNQIVFGDQVNAQLATGGDVTARVDVNANAPQNLPEPGSTWLVAIGCAALAVVWKARAVT